MWYSLLTATGRTKDLVKTHFDHASLEQFFIPSQVKDVIHKSISLSDEILCYILAFIQARRLNSFSKGTFQCLDKKRILQTMV